MNNQITIRSDRKDDYTFQYKGEDVTLRAGSIISIADGLTEVVFPTTKMKIVKNLIVIKDDEKQLKQFERIVAAGIHPECPPLFIQKINQPLMGQIIKYA